MNSTSLQDFVSRVSQTGRIGFGDLKRLKRDILPGRLTSREDAELLLLVDRAAHKADPDWAAYLVSTVRDFVVWGMPPVGMVDQCKAEWLISASQGSKASRAIQREVIGMACEVDDALTGLSRSRRARIELDQRDKAGFEGREPTLAPDAEVQSPLTKSLLRSRAGFVRPAYSPDAALGL